MTCTLAQLLGELYPFPVSLLICGLGTREAPIVLLPVTVLVKEECLKICIIYAEFMSDPFFPLRVFALIFFVQGKKSILLLLLTREEVYPLDF